MLTTKEGLGLELANLLREHLGIPETATAFSVHFEDTGLVTVDVSYIPVERVTEQPPEKPDPVAAHNARKL